jgi:hypothetical protein
MNEIKIFCPATIANPLVDLMCWLCLDNVGDEIIRKSDQKNPLKLWVPIYHWKRKRCGCWTGFAMRLKTNFGFDIEIYKK